MKKLLFLIGALLISVSIMAQEQTAVQTRTQTQTQAQTGEQSGDPIMVQERIRLRENVGQGTMTRSERREMRKENHGATVSDFARNTEANRGETVRGVAQQKGIQQRDRVNFQAKPRTNRPVGFGVPQGARNNAGAAQRGGKR